MTPSSKKFVLTKALVAIITIIVNASPSAMSFSVGSFINHAPKMAVIGRSAKWRIRNDLVATGQSTSYRKRSHHIHSAHLGMLLNTKMCISINNQPDLHKRTTPLSPSPHHRRMSTFTMRQQPRSLIALRMISSAQSAELAPSSLPLLESLNDEERSTYHELSMLSARIRKLDELYYGGGKENETTETTSLEVSDDEYDALARREAEICTLHPNLLTILEEETGLGKRATRFGGRVGKLYSEEEEEGNGLSMDEEKSSKNNKKASSKSKRTATKKRIKRRHLENAPMQSLDNAMDDGEAVAWLNRIRKMLLASYAADTTDDDTIDISSNRTQTIPIQIMAEPKIDGLSLSLRYQLRDSAEASGELIYDFVWGATRGDGTQGEDVTDAVQSAWMKNGTGSGSSEEDDAFSIPKSFTIQHQSSASDAVEPPSILEIRGEVVLPQKAFDEFTQNVTNAANDTAIKTFSNARNAASGILLRSKEPTSDEEIERTRFLQSRLQFYAYDIVSSQPSTNVDESSWLFNMVCSNGDQMRKSLTDLGFCVPTPVVMESLDISIDKEVNETDVPDLLEYHRSLMATRDEGIDETTPSKKKTKKLQNTDFPYQIDGVVYKLSPFADREICGSSSRTPRWAIAHKFPPLVQMTRLLDIEVQVGRTGALTPVAILEPVDLGGVMVSRASLHNFHFARKMLLPGKSSMNSVESETDAINNGSMSVERGVSVLVSRAGDVIPQVMKRVFDSDDGKNDSTTKDSKEMISLEIPQKCPACGSRTSFEFISPPVKKKKTRKKTKKDDDSGNESNLLNNETDEITTLIINSGEQESSDEAENGQVLRCSGPQLLCQPRAVNALAYAYSRAGLDVKGLSKSKLSHLLDEEIIRFPSDLFATFGDKNGEDRPSEVEQEVLDRIADLPGWGELSSQNLAESVQTVASEGVSLSRYIYSLGIPLIGTQASQLVASAYGNVESFLNALEEAALYNDDEIVLDEEGKESTKSPFPALTGDDGSEKVKGIGPTAISALLSFSKEEMLLKAAKDLANALNVHDVKQSNTTINERRNQKPSQFEGKTVVFTGSLPGMSRTEAQTAVKALGAKATPNTVSKSTDIVVEGEKGGKKARQARDLGIHVIDYTEFMKMLNE